jgi:hypothetical protein
MSAAPFDVIWPLHRHHYLTIPHGELGESSPDVTQQVRSSDYRTIIAACDGEWRSAIEIQVRIEATDIASVSKSLQRAAENGALQRIRMKINRRMVWGYRRFAP